LLVLLIERLINIGGHLTTNLANIYKPIVRENIKIDGVAAETIPIDAVGKIFRKQFLSSYDTGFEKTYDNILKTVLGVSPNESLNKLIAVIKKDNKAHIYMDFPLSIQARMKKEKKAFELVYYDDIMDIIGVNFSDALFTLDIESGDKFIWLFRINWKFGLFFDFTGSLEPKQLSEELAACYKRLLYLDTYSFLEQQNYFNELLRDGWFPFIQLIGDHFQHLIEHYMDNKNYNFRINDILSDFTQDKVKVFSNNWWNNPVFKAKKDIIEAGIEAYFQGTKSGYINAIKNFSTEIEGILRIAYFIDYRKDPTTSEIKRYISDHGKKSFSSVGSLGFPYLFYTYLNESIFENFDLKTDKIPPSRHSYAHGVARIENYDQVRAFQLILTLDQIFFFLGTIPNNK
jgi:hypothetical protein